MIEQLHQDMPEFVFNGTTIVLPELIRLFECSDQGIGQLHEELEALCIDINLSKVSCSCFYRDFVFNGLRFNLDGDHSSAVSGLDKRRS